MSEVRSPKADEISDVHVRLGSYELSAATEFGPRVTGLRPLDGPQIFAELPPEVCIEHADVGTYVFRGGHRLWASPEIPERTYVPDDRPCEVKSEDGALVLIGPRDQAGFQKQMEIRLRGDRLVVDHRLRWAGTGPVRVASWAITQLPLGGGVGILPIATHEENPPLQADSSLVLWPYTRMDDPRVSFQERTVLIEGESGPQLKFGSGPAPGALGYLRDGYLFIKRFSSVPGVRQPDRGAIGQVYVNEHFLELESVGPFDDLKSGDETGHRETWEVTECAGVDAAVTAVLQSR